MSAWLPGRAARSWTMLALLASAMGACAGAAGSGDGTDEPAGLTGLAGHIGARSQSLAAHCSVNVVGFGVKDVETNYLPRVVNCEFGDGDWEALKAQAVAARTYLYYKLGTSGTAITSGTHNQVYSCARDKLLSQRHHDAVKATSGQVLMSGSLVIWSCFNAGSKPSNPDCKPGSGGADNCITYNEGKTGSAVTPSPCGHPANPKNRGCLSQNGSHCLSLKGKGYREILRFYYGADIKIVNASGSCVGATPDAGAPSKPDAATPAMRDSGAPSSQRDSAGAKLPAVGDSGAPGQGGASDIGATPGASPDAGNASGLAGAPGGSLGGGCSAGGTVEGAACRDLALALALLLALALATRRRKATHHARCAQRAARARNATRR